MNEAELHAARPAATLPSTTGLPRAFPDAIGYYVVSAVGFDESKTHAFVFAAFHGANGMLRGASYALEKVGVTWRRSSQDDVQKCFSID